MLYRIKYYLFQSADTGLDRLILHLSVCCLLSQTVVPGCAYLLNTTESIIGYNFIPLYIHYILFSVLLYSLSLITLAYVTFTSTSEAKLCIFVIIFLYCALNQSCRFLMNCDFHCVIGTMCIAVYDARYMLYLGIKWLFNFIY